MYSRTCVTPTPPPTPSSQPPYRISTRAPVLPPSPPPFPDLGPWTPYLGVKICPETDGARGEVRVHRGVCLCSQLRLSRIGCFLSVSFRFVSFGVGVCFVSFRLELVFVSFRFVCIWCLFLFVLLLNSLYLFYFVFFSFLADVLLVRFFNQYICYYYFIYVFMFSFVLKIFAFHFSQFHLLIIVILYLFITSHINLSGQSFIRRVLFNELNSHMGIDFNIARALLSLLSPPCNRSVPPPR